MAGPPHSNDPSGRLQDSCVFFLETHHQLCFDDTNTILLTPQQALHLARAEKNLALEETLFRVVIGIYRNPIKLIDVTADPEGRTESYPPAPIDLEAAILGEESSDNEEDDEDDEVYETPVQGSPTT